MNFSGANVFSDDNNYTIYTMNSAVAGQYCVILPKGANSKMNMLVDLHMKDSFDAVSNNTKNKDELIGELKKEYGEVILKYPNCIMVFPMLDNALLVNSVASGDKQKMFDEVKKIGAITNEIYKKLTESGVDKNNIDQKIVVVKKDENDNKFVDWLKEQMPNFVDGMDYNTNNAVVNNTNQETVSNDIFAQPDVNVPVEPVPEVAPVQENNVPVEPVVPETTPVIENDIFGGGTSEVQEQAPVVPEPTPVVAKPTPVVQSTEPTPAVNTPQSQEVQPSSSLVNDAEPKAVSSTELNGTTTFSPIIEPTPAPVSDVTPTVENNVNIPEGRKKSGGFANLLILLVVLIGVTIASIELGKYLFSVYGAK